MHASGMDPSNGPRLVKHQIFDQADQADQGSALGTWRRMIMLVLFVYLLLVGIKFTGLNRNVDPNVLMTPDCILPLGGGAALLGGSFPHFTYDNCKEQIDAYFADNNGAYYQQVSRVAQAAIQYLKTLQTSSPPSRDQVFVFDIDETTLSNKVEWNSPATPAGLLGRHSFLNKHPGCHSTSVASSRLPPSLAAWQEARGTVTTSQLSAVSSNVEDVLEDPKVESGDRPALVAVRSLYMYAIKNGYSVAFITGRKEAGRAFTARNLAKAGYGTACTPGQEPTVTKLCYVALHLRDEDDNRPASVYKPERRQALMDAGYTLVGNIGDQFSDLEGLFEAQSSWKLPNPMYYIL